MPMTINEKIDLLLRMQIHYMNPNGSGESTTMLIREAKHALMTPAIEEADSDLEIVEELLLELGVPHHLVGYKAMVEAILVAKNNPASLRAITKVLYPTVADKVGSTPSKVERSIRHAIRTCFSRASFETLEKYFGQTVNPNTGVPTVSEFIAIMADTANKVDRKNKKGE